MSTTVLVNFYESIANLPSKVKTVNLLQTFVSEKFQMSLEDAKELDFYYYGEDKTKVVVKNNLDLTRALFFFKSQENNKTLYVEVKEESRLFKEYASKDEPIQNVSQNMKKCELSEIEKIKLELEEKQRLLKEIEEKEKEEKEKLEIQELIKKKEEAKRLREEQALKELENLKEEMDRKAKEESEMLNRMIEENKEKNFALDAKKKTLNVLKKAVKDKKEKKELKEKEEKVEKVGKEEKKPAPVDAFTQLKRMEKFVTQHTKKAVEISFIKAEVLKKQTQEKEKKKLLKQHNKIHENYRCNGCGVMPIVGVRYHCTIYDNFDYCEECEEKYSESDEHVFIKIRDPKQALIEIKTEKKDEKEKEGENKGFFNELLGEVKNLKNYIPVLNKSNEKKVEKNDYTAKAESMLHDLDLGVSVEELAKILQEVNGNEEEAIARLFK